MSGEVQEQKAREALLKAIRDYLLTLDDEARWRFFHEIRRGYCGSCGGELSADGAMCHCENDE